MGGYISDLFAFLCLSHSFVILDEAALINTILPLHFPRATINIRTFKTHLNRYGESLLWKVPSGQPEQTHIKMSVTYN